MDMFAGHLPELIILLVLVVFVFGAKRLPDVGSGLGKGIAEFRRSITAQDDSHQIERATTDHTTSADAPPPGPAAYTVAPEAEAPRS
jgi:sec-independent protein translocase protein TatA